MLKLYLGLAVGLVVLSGAFSAGWRINGWRLAAQEAKAADFAQKAGDAATVAAVAAIKAQQPKNVTINRAVEKETRVETRYSDAACQHTTAAWSLLDSAYQAAGGEPFGGGAVLSAPAAPVGP